MAEQVCEDRYYGYDPDIMEPGPFEDLPAARPDLPARFLLDQNKLPPVGEQGQAGDCFVWASAYGALTYKIASKPHVSAHDTSNQPAVGYTYIAYLSTLNLSSTPSCPGGQVGPFLTFLNGTPSENSCPTAPGTNCGALWSAYAAYNGNNTPTDDPRFQTKFLQMSFETGENISEDERSGTLNSIKTLMVNINRPLIFGTSLYRGWEDYRPGPPVDGRRPVYVGHGPLWTYKNGSKVGHVMIIVGYDSTLSDGRGAFLIQNSSGAGWGTTWNGHGGYVWMDCHTFMRLAQGTLTILTD